MKPIPEKEWKSVGGFELEENADLIVRNSTESALVVAGPGAGKTELLAQRACFLLQTNICKYPNRILAISFKRDAAYHLKDRVTLRAGTDLSARFDSLTYDSFAKQLFDRFKSALPAEYKVPNEYEIVFDGTIQEIYKNIDSGYFNTRSVKGVMDDFTGRKLSVNDSDAVRVEVWKQAMAEGTLTFKMVMRLADLIIEKNPTIKLYLQTTYQFVFLDEFQDTTTVQYDFLKSCFLGSNRILTAVGDDKQRIMGWAGALKTVFDDFQNDNNANRVPLTMNFRSAPKLVAVQNSLIQHLLGKSDFANASKMFKHNEGECLIWDFKDQDHEAEHLVKSIRTWLDEKVDPRDICILVKGSLDKYVGVLIDTLRANKINARDESVYQEFLTDEVILYLVHSLYMILGSPKGDSKKIVFEFLSRVHNEMSDVQLLKLDNRMSLYFTQLKTEHKKKLEKDHITALIQRLVEYSGMDRIRSVFAQYRQVAYLKEMLANFEKTLIEYFEKTPNFQTALNQFCGDDTIPVMTVHKSKGLEYHTVVFVGLEDNAFWSFASQADEDKQTFFVALSRAKMRVVFTFSKVRKGLYKPNQARDKIDVIFKELQRAGASVQTFA